MEVADLKRIKGFKISKKLSVSNLVRGMEFMGFQASHVFVASRILKKMWEDNALVMLSFTSNMVSSGLREVFAQMVKKRMVDVIITAIGSIEEDFIKCFSPFLLGSFYADDAKLHKMGINRIGNVFVPNDRYVLFEKKIQPFLKKMFKKQKKFGRMLSPSEIIFEMGKEVSDKNSIIYWARKRGVPIFCPAVTDGAFGMQVYFFKEENPGFGIDVTADMKKMEEIVMSAKKTGGIILGGGVAKHHLIGTNVLRGGLDYAIYVTTATEYDGSLSGAREREAVSWGKISEHAKKIFVEGDATVIFPLLLIGALG